MRSHEQAESQVEEESTFQLRGTAKKLSPKYRKKKVL
jgi:hypothetical protein